MQMSDSSMAMTMTMAASNLSEEGIVDKRSNLPESCTCFQLIKPTFAEIDPHCGLDVFPILLEEASLQVRDKCPFHGSHGQDVYSFSVLPEDGNCSPESAPELALLSFLEVPISSKQHIGLHADLNCQECISLKIEETNAYPPCIVDIDIEKANSEPAKSVEETIGSTKIEGAVTHFQKVLQRQSSFKTGERFLQILMNHGLMLLKFSARDKSLTEKVQDVPNNRLRRSKRAASIDSRKIVLLFSILSIMGTLVLIYLTLRVRQSADGYARV